MKQKKSPNPSNTQQKSNKVLDKFAIPLSVTVLGGIIVGVALLFISPIINDIIIKPMLNNNTPTSSTAFFDSTLFCKAILNEVDFNNIIPDKDTLSEIISPGTDSDGYNYYNITSNGTMPKGTAPVIVLKAEEMIQILSSIQQLSLGCSKKWVDNKLGTPFVENIVDVTEIGRIRYDYNGDMIDTSGNKINEDDIVDSFLECVYYFDNIVSVTAYFDTSSNSCEAFFVTLLKDTLDVDIVMPEAYAFLTSNKALGEFTFTEILGEPIDVYGYVSQGNARAFYGEQHYFAAAGNYQEFYFAVLDYGMLNSLEEYILFLSGIQFDIKPGNYSTDSYHSSTLLEQQRNKLYPNTYGISKLNYEITFSLIGTYDVGFDSYRLR